ncbi:hypothetical protein AKJ16_DCAP16544 [Drosera capensis]
MIILIAGSDSSANYFGPTPDIFEYFVHGCRSLPRSSPAMAMILDVECSDIIDKQCAFILEARTMTTYIPDEELLFVILAKVTDENE